MLAGRVRDCEQLKVAVAPARLDCTGGRSRGIPRVPQRRRRPPPAATLVHARPDRPPQQRRHCHWQPEPDEETPAQQQQQQQQQQPAADERPPGGWRHGRPRGRRRMANSRYEYVKQYEQDATLLPGCFIVVRVDGKGFTKFAELHGFEKPNDKRALDLMDACACEVLREFPDVRLAYGTSDEYSFVLAPSTALYGRRTSKIVSVLTSFFTASYVRWWGDHMGCDAPLRATPAFDGRAVCYPTAATLRDYLSWRQADCHINNQYNTPYWCLVKAGATPSEAQRTLAGTDAGFKNELLYSRFGINYNELPEQFRKGSVVVRARERFVARLLDDGTPVERERGCVAVLHTDIIREAFWRERPETLAP